MFSARGSPEKKDVFGLEQRGAVGDGDFRPSDGGGYVAYKIGFVERPEMSRRSRRCPEDVQEVSRRLEKNVGTSRDSSAGVQKASGVVEGLTQSGKAVGHTCLKESPPRVSNPVSHGL